MPPVLAEPPDGRGGGPMLYLPSGGTAALAPRKEVPSLIPGTSSRLPTCTFPTG